MFRCDLPPTLFGRTDRGILRATAVTQGWNRYRIRVSTQLILEKKILSPLLPGSNSQSFDHESGVLPATYPGSRFCGVPSAGSRKRFPSDENPESAIRVSPPEACCRPKTPFAGVASCRELNLTTYYLPCSLNFFSNSLSVKIIIILMILLLLMIMIIYVRYGSSRL